MTNPAPDTLRISVPDDSWLDVVEQRHEVVVWDSVEPQPDGRIDLVLWPYTLDPSLVSRIDTSRVGVIQGQSLGFDGIADHLGPGGVYCNAVGVHEESTAELAVTLALAAQREVPTFVRQQSDSTWQKHFTGSLIDRTVMVLGVGGIGGEVVARLEGFGCEIVRVASTARDDDRGRIHAIDEVHDLLPRVDVVIVAVPLTPATAGLIDADFLSRLRDDSLVVNVARGKVVDSEAMVAEVGRLRFASDVWDPEPLPADHPLWSAEGVLLIPHVGGMTSAMRPRVEKLVRQQVRALEAGEPPVNVAVRT